VTELALDDDQRHALAAIPTAWVCRREAPPHAGLAGDA
jgi:hypothetical protein